MVREGSDTARRLAKRAKVFAITKGFRGRAKNCYSIAVRSAEKALQHSYRGRKEKKREMRKLWIQRINFGAREHDASYSCFISGLIKCDIQLNRKVLSEIAVHEPRTFKALVDIAKCRQSRSLYATFNMPQSSLRSLESRYIPRPTTSPTKGELYKTRLVLDNDGKRLVQETDV